MILISGPETWNPAYRPIVFEYDHEEVTLSSISNSGGYLRISLSTAFTEGTPVAGDLIYVDITLFAGGTVTGGYRVREVTSTTVFILDKAWPGSGYGSVKWGRLPEIKVYAGYDSGEGYDSDLPLTLVGTFTPRNSPDNTVRFDISGYLQSIFTIAAPAVDPPSWIDFALFNRFRLYFDGSYQPETYQVLNSTISAADLLEYYVETGRYLCEADTPFLNDCGATILSRIESGGIVRSYLWIDGELSGALEEFAAADFYSTDFSTT